MELRAARLGGRGHGGPRRRTGPRLPRPDPAATRGPRHRGAAVGGVVAGARRRVRRRRRGRHLPAGGGAADPGAVAGDAPGSRRVPGGRHVPRSHVGLDRDAPARQAHPRQRRGRRGGVTRAARQRCRRHLAAVPPAVPRRRLVGAVAGGGGSRLGAAPSRLRSDGSGGGAALGRRRVGEPCPDDASPAARDRPGTLSHVDPRRPRRWRGGELGARLPRPRRRSAGPHDVRADRGVLSGRHRGAGGRTSLARHGGEAAADLHRRDRWSRAAGGRGRPHRRLGTGRLARLRGRGAPVRGIADRRSGSVRRTGEARRRRQGRRPHHHRR